MLMFLVSLVALALAAYSVWRVMKTEKQSLLATGLAGDKSDQVAQLRSAINGVDARLNTFMDYLAMQADLPDAPSHVHGQGSGSLQCDGDVCHITPNPPRESNKVNQEGPNANFASMADQMLGCFVNMMSVPDAVVSSANDPDSRVEEIADDTDSEVENVEALE